MNPQITRYFSPGIKFIPPVKKDDLKITIHYFEKDQIEPVAEPWSKFRYGLKYEGLKLFYRGKIVNLRFPPSFLDEFPHTPGTIAETFVSIHDRDLYSGQFIKNDKCDIWYYDVVEKQYYTVGEGVIDEVIDQTIVCWTPKAFTYRYKNKLSLLKDTDGFQIDITDALSKLSFVDTFDIKLTGDAEHLFQIEIHPRNAPTKDDLKELVHLLTYLSYGTFRYRINYENSLNPEEALIYNNPRILFATWNDFEFVTIKIITI